MSFVTLSRAHGLEPVIIDYIDRLSPIMHSFAFIRSLFFYKATLISDITLQ